MISENRLLILYSMIFEHLVGLKHGQLWINKNIKLNINFLRVEIVADSLQKGGFISISLLRADSDFPFQLFINPPHLFYGGFILEGSEVANTCTGGDCSQDSPHNLSASRLGEF